MGIVTLQSARLLGPTLRSGPTLTRMSLKTPMPIRSFGHAIGAIGEDHHARGAEKRLNAGGLRGGRCNWGVGRGESVIRDQLDIDALWRTGSPSSWRTYWPCSTFFRKGIP